VVPISLSTYLLLCFIAFALAIKVFAIVAVIGFIYFLFRYPRETIGLVLLLLTFQYWQITLPLLAIWAIAKHFIGTKKVDTSSPPTLLIEHISQEEK
jgi:hypothetical protein